MLIQALDKPWKSLFKQSKKHQIAFQKCQFCILTWHLEMEE